MNFRELRDKIEAEFDERPVKWDVIELPSPWESMTAEERERWERAIVDQVVSVRYLPKPDIESMYGPPITP